ncbi:MAG: glycosyltransferase family 4 protein [Pseudomonadales bacterium]
MTILFLSHSFPPEVNAPATRTYEHCKRWVELGHEVTVITCVPHHPMGKVYPGYKNRFYSSESIDGIQVVRLLTYVTANQGLLKRTANYVTYMLMCIFAAPFLRKADIVVSTSPQFFNGLAGYFVSRIKRARWILEIRDLWPESILAVRAIENRRAISVLEWLERFTYRKADHIVALTNAFKQHIIRCGADASKISVIRNGVDLEKFAPVARDPALEQEWGIAGKFVAAYVGTHGMAHGLKVILDAAELLRDDPEIIFLMAGDGAERASLARDLAERKLSNVVMLGQKPKEMVPAIWACSDVSLVLLKKLDIFKTVIPSKIFESMATGTPIVLGVQGEVAEIIQAADAGVCITPESAVELAAAVRELKSNGSLYKQQAECGKKYVAEHFERKMLAAQFADIFESVGRESVAVKAA